MEHRSETIIFGSFLPLPKSIPMSDLTSFCQNLKISKLLCTKDPKAWTSHQVIDQDSWQCSNSAKTHYLMSPLMKAQISCNHTPNGTWYMVHWICVPRAWSLYIRLQNKLSLFQVRAMFLQRYSKIKLELKLFSLKILNCPATRGFSVGSKTRVMKLRPNGVTSVVV